MAGAHDQRRPILEHQFLRQIIYLGLFAQRTEHEVDFAIAQRPG